MAKATLTVTDLQRHIRDQDAELLGLKNELAALRVSSANEIQVLREQRNTLGTKVEQLETEKVGRHAVNRSHDELERRVEQMGSLPANDQETKLFAFLSNHLIQSLRNPDFRRACHMLLRAAWEAHHDLEFVQGLIGYMDRSWKGRTSPIGVVRLDYQKIEAMSRSWNKEQTAIEEGKTVDAQDANDVDESLTTTGDAG